MALISISNACWEKAKGDARCLTMAHRMHGERYARVQDTEYGRHAQQR
ncbi:hypothetical protein PATSB16_25550 [Pandoraea thiooxydans]|nr:hypothetical protein PATSB16_25550 [Pandoraea thiooxydans]